MLWWVSDTACVLRDERDVDCVFLCCLNVIVCRIALTRIAWPFQQANHCFTPTGNALVSFGYDMCFMIRERCQLCLFMLFERHCSSHCFNTDHPAVSTGKPLLYPHGQCFGEFRIQHVFYGTRTREMSIVSFHAVWTSLFVCCLWLSDLTVRSTVLFDDCCSFAVYVVLGSLSGEFLLQLNWCRLFWCASLLH
jgi:hypothetical protein